MKALVDTQIFLWAIATILDSRRRSAPAIANRTTNSI